MEQLKKKLYKKILDFNKSKVQEDRLSFIIDNALEVFSEIPHLESASVYFMDKENFELYHSKTRPAENKETIEKVFPILLEKGYIGSALSTLDAYFDNSDDALIEGKFYIVFPMIDSKGVGGLIIFQSSEKPSERIEELSDLTTLFASLFASTYENIKVSQKNNKNQELLDQQVAHRTMKLVENQKQMADKFENLRSNLSMSIPHEVRTPINQILGFADFLLKYYETTEIEDAHEMLNDIYSSAKRLKELFENYLYYANLSILSTNVYEIMNLQQKVTPSIEAVLYDIVAYKAEVFERMDDIEIEIDDAAISISEEYIKKVVTEIIDNAFKYSDVGTKVKVTCKKIEDKDIHSEGICEIDITDYGRGMNPEQIQNIDAYMQFDRKVYEQQGSGLGISIVQRIIDLHNGVFKIESTPGEFTKVIVKVPLSNKMNDF